VKPQLCLLPLVGLITAGATAPKDPNANSREHMIAGMTTVFKAWDKDGDGRLSRAELTAMMDAFFQRVTQHLPNREMTQDLDRQRQEMIAYYMSQDTNHDGYLTLDELLKQPLANFDCMDQNRDGKLTQEEIFSGMDRCGTVNLEDYAPKN
jgi:Ca2+-binding EF-hand superfamily protein